MYNMLLIDIFILSHNLTALQMVTPWVGSDIR